MIIRILKIASIATVGAVGVYLVVGLVGLSPTAADDPPGEVGMFDDVRSNQRAAPPLQSYRAGDGTILHYRSYMPAVTRASTPVLVLIHGSAYHSAYLSPLARELAEHGGARVYTPDLRGHGPKPLRRGDVDYIGQLEDDLDGFLGRLRADYPQAPVLLGGHSSGGGLVIRYAGGDHRARPDGYLLLAPYIHHSAPTDRSTEAGWADPNVPRLIGLSLLNNLGIRIFNGLSVIRFQMPAVVRDGSEALRYSYRMQTSMHPRDDYGADLASLDAPTLVLVGKEDQVFLADAYPSLFERHTEQARVRLLEGVGHLGIIDAPATDDAITAWLATK